VPTKEFEEGEPKAEDNGVEESAEEPILEDKAGEAEETKSEDKELEDNKVEGFAKPFVESVSEPKAEADGVDCS